MQPKLSTGAKPSPRGTPTGALPTGANLDPHDRDAQTLLTIKQMAGQFSSGTDHSERAAGKVLMAIESKVTERLIAKGIGPAN